MLTPLSLIISAALRSDACAGGRVQSFTQGHMEQVALFRGSEIREQKH